MKRFDIIIIIFVLTIGVGLFAYYYDRFNVDLDNSLVAIKYQNMTIDEIEYNEELNYTYTIYGVNRNKLIVVIEQEGVLIEEKSYDINLSKDIRNRISLSFDKIEMDYEPHDHDHKLDWPNCPNKSCTKIYMDSSHILPIVCVNGISVEFITGNKEIPTPVS